MAKPIKDTPVLKGKDAKKFIAQHSAKKDENTLKAERDRILKNSTYFIPSERFNEHTPA